MAIYQFTINTLITKAKADIETRIETVRTKLGLNNTVSDSDSDNKIEELNVRIDALTAAVAKLVTKKA